MLQEAKVTIEGKTPLLMNRYTGDEIAPPNMAKLSESEAWDYARERAYLDEDGKPYIPNANLQQCLVNGGKKCKGKGRGTLSQAVAGAVQVLEERIPLKAKPLELFRNIRKNPSTGGKMLQYRVRIPDPWKATFTVAWDDEVIMREQMMDVLRAAGMRVGLMDWRPEKRGCYGQFVPEMK